MALSLTILAMSPMATRTPPIQQLAAQAARGMRRATETSKGAWTVPERRACSHVAMCGLLESGNLVDKDLTRIGNPGKHLNTAI